MTANCDREVIRQKASDVSEEPGADIGRSDARNKMLGHRMGIARDCSGLSGKETAKALLNLVAGLGRCARAECTFS